MAKVSIGTEGDHIPAVGMAPAGPGNGAEKGTSSHRTECRKHLFLNTVNMTDKTHQKRVNSAFFKGSHGLRKWRKAAKNGILKSSKKEPYTNDRA